MVGMGVPGRETSMAQGQRLEDCNIFQEPHIIEHSWYVGVRWEDVVGKGLGKGEAGQDLDKILEDLSILLWNLDSSVHTAITHTMMLG